MHRADIERGGTKAGWRHEAQKPEKVKRQALALPRRRGKGLARRLFYKIGQAFGGVGLGDIVGGLGHGPR
jgi:hypothetical protein